MKFLYIKLLFFYLIILDTSIHSQNLNTNIPEGVTHIDIILLMGQSNMKGRGKVPKNQIINPRIISMNMTNNKWYGAEHPLHSDGNSNAGVGNSNAGVGSGLDFAEEVISKDSTALVALIPLAKGGSNINLWASNRKLYMNTIERTKKALLDFPDNLQVSVKAVLWLQGELDAKGELYKSYETKLLKLVEDIRKDIDNPKLPFIAATIGYFIKEIDHKYPNYNKINTVLLNVSIPYYTCVNTSNFGQDIGDHLHYDVASQIRIGKLMAQSYLELKEL